MQFFNRNRVTLLQMGDSTTYATSCKRNPSSSKSFRFTKREGGWDSSTLDKHEAKHDDITISSTTSLPGYHLGHTAKCRSHMIVPSSSESAIKYVSSLKPLDFAFVKRTSGEWTYGIVADLPFEKDGPSVRIVLDEKGSTKTIGVKYWSRAIRLTKNSIDERCVTSKKKKDKGSSKTKGKSSKEDKASGRTSRQKPEEGFMRSWSMNFDASCKSLRSSVNEDASGVSYVDEKKGGDGYLNMNFLEEMWRDNGEFACEEEEEDIPTSLEYGSSTHDRSGLNRGHQQMMLVPTKCHDGPSVHDVASSFNANGMYLRLGGVSVRHQNIVSFRRLANSLSQ